LLPTPLGAPGIGPALPQVTQVALADWSAGEREAWWNSWLAAKEKPADQPPKPKPAVVEKPAKPVVQKPPHVVVLGDDESFNIRVEITNDGGGIKSLVLTRFQEADRMGLPVKDEQLHLIPEGTEETDRPAFLLYHFGKPNPKPEDNNNPPLDTLGKLRWTIPPNGVSKNGDTHQVILTADPPPVVMDNGKPHRVFITKTYTLKSSDYHIGLEVEFKLDPDDKEKLDFGYQLAGPLRMPIEGVWYTNVYRNAIIGGRKGKDDWRDLQDNRTIGIQGGGRDLLREKNEAYSIQFAGITTQFFASMMVVDNDQKEKNFIQWARPTLEKASPNPNQQFLDDITARVNADVKLEPGAAVVHKYLLYNGPVKVRLLGQLGGEKEVPPELVDRYETTLHLNLLTDYGRWGPWSSVIIFFTNVMHRLLWLLHTYVMPWSYGICIIVLTVLVRGSVFPLSRKQAIQGAKMQAKMRELAPEFKQLEDKFKNDPMGLQQAKHELMMKRGVNPMAMLGTCWIVLLQMPVFLGLYYALQESILFRLAPFLWMKNLAAPDMLIRWGNSIPWISLPSDQGSSWIFLGPAFNILPVIWVVLQIIQQKMMMLPPTNEQEAMQQKMMKFMMLFVGIWGFKLPAGLVLYFMASALWSVTERKLLPKSKLAAAAPGGAGPAAPGQPKAPPRPQPKPGNGNGVLGRVKDWWETLLKEAEKNASHIRDEKSSKKQRKNKQNQPNRSGERGP
jgi:YidC/Oxa1 family membrane protein insertase